MRLRHMLPVVLVLTVSASVLRAQHKATTEDGKVVILNPDGTWKYAEARGKARLGAAQPEPLKKPEQEMTDSEKVESWRGEQIILLVDPESDVIFGSPYGVYKRGEKGKALPAASYGHKVGTIVEAQLRIEDGRQKPFLVARLDDTGEEILLEGTYAFDFIANMKMAEVLVGTPLWTKGTAFGGLPPGTRVTVTKALWGKFGVLLELTSGEGLVGSTWFSDQLNNCREKRYELGRCEAGEGSQNFYLEDPRKRYSTWTAATWRKIESGVIEPGMTLEMLEASCGSDLDRVGGQWVEEKKLLTDVYECRGNLIMVANNKVLEWKKK